MVSDILSIGMANKTKSIYPLSRIFDLPDERVKERIVLGIDGPHDAHMIG